MFGKGHDYGTRLLSQCWKYVISKPEATNQKNQQICREERGPGFIMKLQDINWNEQKWKRSLVIVTASHHLNGGAEALIRVEGTMNRLASGFFTKKRSRIFPFQHANTLWHTSESTTEEICSGLRWRISRKNPRWCQFLRKERQQTWKKMFMQAHPSSAHRFVFLQSSNLMNFFFYCALKSCSETKNSLFITSKWAQICVFWAELL